MRGIFECVGRGTVCVLAGVFGLIPLAAYGQEQITIRMANLTIPAVAPVVANTMKQRGFDAKNRFNLEIKTFPSISGYYAAIATGDVDVLLGGANVLQKMRGEGVKATIIGTALRLSDLVIVTKNPALKSIADLKGKVLAADMGSQQYQVAAIYAQAKGINLGKDVTVVQASFALARSQLAADRVDAAMVIEPIATAMILEDPKLNIIFNGSEAWKEITGQEGWELLAVMREDFIKRHPAAPELYVGALRDTANFIHTRADETDRIAVSSVRLKPGIVKEAIASGRWKFEVYPAWGQQRASIWDMFERAKAANFVDKLPDPGILYAP